MSPGQSRAAASPGSEEASDVERIRERADAIEWYHTLELAPGVVTEGMFDLRPVVDRYRLPERLDGLRVLDVGTWDGFWAFEMERRGAAEVVSIDLEDERDLDWPAARRPNTFPDKGRGDGYRLAHEIYGSQVQREVISVYAATPEELGTFDLIFCGSVLIHLRDPLLAMERIANLCRGTFVSVEAYSRLAGLSPIPAAFFRADRDKAVVFWEPSARTWRRMLAMSGFSTVEQKGRFRLRAREGWHVPHVVHHAHRGSA
jgi:tRNA (mo5U34)-methyltransferase